MGLIIPIDARIKIQRRKKAKRQRNNQILPESSTTIELEDDGDTSWRQSTKNGSQKLEKVTGGIKNQGKNQDQSQHC